MKKMTYLNLLNKSYNKNVNMKFILYNKHVNKNNTLFDIANKKI